MAWRLHETEIMPGAKYIAIPMWSWYWFQSQHVGKSIFAGTNMHSKWPARHLWAIVVIEYYLMRWTYVRTVHCRYAIRVLTHWRDGMGTLSALLATLWGESTDHCGFPWQRASNAGLWYFFDVSPNKLLNKHSSGRWSETSWRSCGITVMSGHSTKKIFVWAPQRKP